MVVYNRWKDPLSQRIRVSLVYKQLTCWIDCSIQRAMIHCCLIIDWHEWRVSNLGTHKLQSFWHKNMFCLWICLNFLKGLIEAQISIVNSVCKIPRVLSGLVFLFNQLYYAGGHLCFWISLNYWLTNSLLNLTSWCLEQRLLNLWMILSKVFIDPDFNIALLIDSNHLIMNIEWPKFVIAILVPS